MRREDYTAAAREAARSVLLELATLLGEYREEIVIVGGWVLELVLAGTEAPLLGTIDVDLALDQARLQDPGYATLLEKLTAAGYTQQSESRQPFRFIRRVVLDGETYDVPVDLLAAEYGGRGKKHEHQKIQDIRARKARGCDLCFEMPLELRIEG